MPAFFHLLVTFVANLFRSRRRLEVENLFLRHQLNIAMRRAPHRVRLRTSERALLVLMTWLWPSLLGLSRVVQPDTILRWHRAGFRSMKAGSGFESSRPHHAVSCKQRFPGSLRIAPNWRGFVCAFCLCKLSIGFHVPFWP